MQNNKHGSVRKPVDRAKAEKECKRKIDDIVDDYLHDNFGKPRSDEEIKFMRFVDNIKEIKDMTDEKELLIKDLVAMMRNAGSMRNRVIKALCGENYNDGGNEATLNVVVGQYNMELNTEIFVDRIDKAREMMKNKYDRKIDEQHFNFLTHCGDHGINWGFVLNASLFFGFEYLFSISKIKYPTFVKHSVNRYGDGLSMLDDLNQDSVERLKITKHDCVSLGEFTVIRMFQRNINPHYFINLFKKHSYIRHMLADLALTGTSPQLFDFVPTYRSINAIPTTTYFGCKVGEKMAVVFAEHLNKPLDGTSFTPLYFAMLNKKIPISIVIAFLQNGASVDSLVLDVDPTLSYFEMPNETNKEIKLKDAVRKIISSKNKNKDVGGDDAVAVTPTIRDTKILSILDLFELEPQIVTATIPKLLIDFEYRLSHNKKAFVDEIMGSFVIENTRANELFEKLTFIFDHKDSHEYPLA